MGTISTHSAASLGAASLGAASLGAASLGIPAAVVAIAGVYALATRNATVVTKATPLLVQAEAAPGSAATGNALPADILVVVANPSTGAPTTDLAQTNFTVIQHFAHPGQTCGFSNNIVAFNNVGTGAYHLQVGPRGCNWAPGEFLLQVMVTSGAKRGQAVAKFNIP